MNEKRKNIVILSIAGLGVLWLILRNKKLPPATVNASITNPFEAMMANGGLPYTYNFIFGGSPFPGSPFSNDQYIPLFGFVPAGVTA